MEEILVMSNKERNRLKILHKLDAGLCKQVEAADWMGVSSRQARNIYKVWKQEGDSSLQPRHKKEISNKENRKFLMGSNETASTASDIICEIAKLAF